MTEIKLKCCPFCGHSAIMANNKEGYYFAYCPNYDCVIGYEQGRMFESEEQAAEAWNRRANA